MSKYYRLPGIDHADFTLSSGDRHRSHSEARGQILITARDANNDTKLDFGEVFNDSIVSAPTTYNGACDLVDEAVRIIENCDNFIDRLCQICDLVNSLLSSNCCDRYNGLNATGIRDVVGNAVEDCDLRSYVGETRNRATYTRQGCQSEPQEETGWDFDVILRAF